MSHQQEDSDPQESQEWRDAFAELSQREGATRARQILDMLAQDAQALRLNWQANRNTPYCNTIAVQEQPVFPGDLAMEERLASIMRWNALAMVVRANQAYGELGGHVASYASAADLFETGFHHFFMHGKVIRSKRRMVVIWCSSNRIAHPACMRVPFLKGAYLRPI